MQKLNGIIQQYCLLLAVALVSVGSGQSPKKRAYHGQHHGESVVSSIFEIPYSCKGRAGGGLRPDDLTILDFTLGTATIRDIQKRFPDTMQVKLAEGEQAEEGICLKNQKGAAVVFATSVMGSPDTLTSIYLAPARLIEGRGVVCKSVTIPTDRFSSRSGIRVAAAATQVSEILHSQVRGNGPFCIAYESPSSGGPLQHSSADKLEGFTDFTGAEGRVMGGKVEWVKLFGTTSN